MIAKKNRPGRRKPTIAKKNRPGRKRLAHIAVYLPWGYRGNLYGITKETGKNMQQLIREALDDLNRKYGQPAVRADNDV